MGHPSEDGEEHWANVPTTTGDEEDPPKRESAGR
jgi:hypothetical protein